MSSERLIGHPHILRQILAHVRQPEPRPNSGAKRSETRQDDLATCMRVSAAFNDVAGRLLYRRIITDDLPSLVVGLLDGPARPDIRSKEDLLGLIDHLGVEYQERYRDPTYTEIFTGRMATINREQFGQTDWIWHNINQKVHAHMAYGFLESHGNLCAAFGPLVQYAQNATGTDQPNHIDAKELATLPKSMSPFSLTSLSFCGIFGGYTAGFNAIIEKYPEFRRRIEEDRDCHGFLLLVGPRTKHLCTRNSTGPLGINRFKQMQLADGHRPSMTGHMHDWSDPWMETQTPVTFVHEKPAVVDESTNCEWRDGRCSSHTHDYHDQLRYSAAHNLELEYVEEAAESIMRMIVDEGKLLPRRVLAKWEAKPKVPVRIYITPQKDEGQPLERKCRIERLQDIQEDMRGLLGRMGRIYDLTVDEAEKAPLCPACGV